MLKFLGVSRSGYRSFLNRKLSPTRQRKENGLTDSISLTTNTHIGLYSSISKPFIIPLGFTVTATICLLMTLKKCMRGYVLCQQLSWQNFSFYFVLNLDTGPVSCKIEYLVGYGHIILMQPQAVI